MSQKHDDSERPRDVYLDRRKMADRRERERRARQERAISSSAVAVLPHEVEYDSPTKTHRVRIDLTDAGEAPFTSGGTWQSNKGGPGGEYRSGITIIAPSAERIREIAVALWSAADEIEETSR